jgi:hypothetical protein
MVRVRRRFDHFMIVRQIGEGGMSRVFEAEDETLGRRVALKILNRRYSRDAERLEQFRQEALITASVTHPNVIKLYSVGHDQGYFYLAMELVGGGSLEGRIRKEGKLTEGDALRIGHQVAEGLRAAQNLGLIHRDVKPANILFTESGTAKVVDFGLALFTERGPDKSAEIWATPYYVAPEKILQNQEDYRSDIFSLGATLFHALTGSPPHQADTHSIEELRRIKSRRVELGDSGLRFSPRTEHVIDHMLSFNPQDRFANYDAVVEELRLADGLLNQSGIRRRLISRRARLIGAAAACILLAFLFGWLLGEGSQRRSRVITKELANVATNATQADGVTVDTDDKRTVTERFNDARREMLEHGKFAEAHDKFEKIARDESNRLITRCWSRFNAALCSLMLKQRPQAEKAFASLAQMAADKPKLAANPDIARFFETLGNRMGDKLGLGAPPEQLGHADTNEEMLGHLAQGLAEWQFGKDPEIAVSEMEHFQLQLAALKKADPETHEWLSLYDKLIDRYERDFPHVRALEEQPVRTLDEKKAALAANEAALKKIRDKSANFIQTLDQQTRALKREIKLAELADLMQRESALRASELEQLHEVVDIIPVLVRGYDHSRVIDLLAGLRFESPDVNISREGHLYIHTSARDFIAQLKTDLAAGKWRGTLTRREGGTVTGLVSAVTGDVLTLQVEGGTLSVALDSLSPESLIDLARQFLEPVTDSADYYRRQELTAAFARASGLTELSTLIAAQLMEENRSFRERWRKVMEAGI